MAKKTKDRKRERRERRFLPQSTHPAILVRALGAIGAAALGAGAWAQFARPSTPVGEPLAYAWWILAAGALVLGVAVWLGTSGEPAVRVGDGGFALDKGSLRRMPWYEVASIAWERATHALVVSGKDEIGGEMSTRVPLRSQPQAVAWIVKEARARVPNVIDLSDEEVEEIPRAESQAGETILLEPVQVVGKRCAQSGKIIAYEPDARVCLRCERVYHKTSVPEKCACTASLAALRAKPSADHAAPAEAADDA